MKNKVTLTNDFHDSSAVVELTGPETYVSKRVAARVRRQLCGIKGCTCGGTLGQRGPQPVDIDPMLNGEVLLRVR